MKDDLKDAVQKAITKIVENRAQIIEEYIEFWLAVNVPTEYLSLQLLDNIVLIEQTSGDKKTYWLEFKSPKDRQES
jgi:hypothetical protein